MATTQHKGLFANMTVARRLYFLILIPLILLFLSGIISITALNTDLQTFKRIDKEVVSIQTGNQFIRRLLRRYLLVLYDVNIGSTTPSEGIEKLQWLEKDLKEVQIPKYKSAGVPDSEATVKEMEKIFPMITKSIDILRTDDKAQLENYLKVDAPKEVFPIRDYLNDIVLKNTENVNNEFLQAENRLRNYLWAGALLILVGTLITAYLGFQIYKSIHESLARLTETMRQISAGNMDARAALGGKDELAELAQNFDNMVEERIATQARIDRDHKQLNESVFSLLEAVSDLSDRNLTVRAKVTEDATGPLADAINQLAEDTTDVLKQVRQVALAVANTSKDVNQYAVTVNNLAQLEQQEAQATSEQVDSIMQRLNRIAQSAQQANQMADTTANTTHQAQTSVTRSVENMTSIRTTVQETGKRLKRLGERSQEISQIIDVINHLAERTTVLALNASMQATAAGEAGRGFSMIAEEIQRLAENSRDSTSQISTLVHNIQQEANTTIATMERTIEQVVNGSTLAEDADKQMQSALDATNQLVSSVEKIAQASAEQVSISQTLQVRAERILQATQATGQELQSLTGLTEDMAAYGQKLIQSVNVFKLEA
jgi:methyl-accepting chemotaxis protein